MKRKNFCLRRLCALLCALALLISVAPAAGAAEPTLQAAAVSAERGSVCTLSIRGSNLNSLAALRLTIYYDPAVLTPVGTTYPAFPVGGSAVLQEPGTYEISAINANGVNGGTLFSVSFQVEDEAELGASTVRISVDEAFNRLLQPVDIGSVQTTVTVKEATTPVARFSGSLTAYAVKAGEDVTLRVYCADSKDMAAGKFHFLYDSNFFAYRSLVVLDMLRTNESVWTVDGKNPGLVSISYGSSIAPPDGGYWMELTLTALENVAGSTTISMVPVDLYAENKTAITAASFTSNVTVQAKEEAEEEKPLPKFWIDVPDALTTAQPFTLFAMVEGSSNLGAADFVLTYDAEVLECLSVESGSGSFMVGMGKNYHDGTIEFSVISGEGVTADTALLGFRMQAKENKAISTVITPSSENIMLQSNLKPLTLNLVPANMEILPTCDITLLQVGAFEGCSASLSVDTDLVAGMTSTVNVTVPEDTDRVKYDYTITAVGVGASVTDNIVTVGLSDVTVTVTFSRTVITQEIEVKASDVSKTFGEEDPAWTYEILSPAELQLQPGEELVVELVREEGEAVGTYAITGTGYVRYNDAISEYYTVAVADGTFTIVPPELVITDSNDYDIPDPVVGTEITPIDVSNAVTGGMEPYSFSAEGLPDGITIHAETGVISGAPTTAAEATTAIITITDANGNEVELEIAVGKVSEPEPKGVTVTGVVTSWNTETSVKVVLYSADMSYAQVLADIKSDAPTGTIADLGVIELTETNRYSQSYAIIGLEAGEYQIAVYKRGHALSLINLSITDEDITEDVALYLIGDVDADGVVGGRDRQILTRYLADWPKYDKQIVSMEAADIDQDGVVGGRDRQILTRYLADWGGTYNEYFNR